MRIAILDPAAGISGDMTLGALVDCGVGGEWARGLPARLGFPDVGVRVERVERCALMATRVLFEIPGADEGDHHHHDAHAHGRHVGALVELVRGLPVSDWVRDRAARAFTLIGEAEGRVHGVPAERVHLHEVGAIDAVLDIVGAIEGFERLGVNAIHHLPVAVGTGWVRAAHGELPVPAPATALLLEGIEVASGGPVEGEATTPTGAALLRVLSTGAPPSRWRLASTGWGAGTRNPADYPNALRLIVAETAPEAGVAVVLATDVDDMSPEYVEPLRQALTAAGALDVSAWATQGKKGRMALRIEVVCAPEAEPAVTAALLEHSTTAGVRRTGVTRVTLPRHEIVVELAGGVRVRIKVWDGPAGRRLKPEFDDVVAAADRLGRPALSVAREAERLAEQRLEHGTTD